MKPKLRTHSLYNKQEAELKAMAQDQLKNESEVLREIIDGVFKKRLQEAEKLENLLKLYQENLNKLNSKDEKEINTPSKTQAEQTSLKDREETMIKKPIEEPSIEEEMDTPSKSQEQKTTEKMDNQEYLKLFANNQNPFTTEELKTRAIEYITTFGTTRQLNKIEEIRKLKKIPENQKERIYNQIIKIENYSLKNHRGTENGIDSLLALFKNNK